MSSDWELDRKETYKGDCPETIVFIRDRNLGRRSVTNDAEAVFADCQNIFGRCRVVYQDSEGEWTEIVRKDSWLGTISFRPWHGRVWDQLSKV